MSRPEEATQTISPVITDVNEATATRTIVPLPGHVSQAESQAGSRTESQARRTWADCVGWDGEFRPLNDVAYKERPEVKKLNELVQESFAVPAWLANTKSPQYVHYSTHMKDRFYIVEYLAGYVSGPCYKTSENDKLSANVVECLPLILHIIYQTHILESKNAKLGAAETDRRHPVDMLGSLVWDFHSDGLVAYRTERQLQIPYAHLKNVSYVKPDACAFIPVPKDIPIVPPQAKSGLSCFFPTQSSPGHKYLLHWVTEFKSRGHTANSRHQVVEGLVSALYQRRAFGFPNHFVFGTAHHSGTTLEVLAATWVRSEPVNSGTYPKHEANAKSTAPAVGQASVPSGSELRGADGAGGESKTDTGVTEDIKKYNKIVVYTIETFSMDDISHLLRLYLLMRCTWRLAQDYQKDIKEDNAVRIIQLLGEAKSFYEWAPPPPPPSDRGMKRRKLNNCLSSVAETEQEEVDADDSMSVDQDYSSDSVSDPQEFESSSDPGPTCRITGEVAKYTLKNYAHEEQIGASD
ncbi:unnamed protein product [Rhizoctonia solani]|uniref:Uncharacterized protein n=1 Tax=Rhizoctonia solani TaxID=456999 RepID=A0A8H3HV44_9AGAM|nr:unnamed protein product [Rhizoctonia solani]